MIEDITPEELEEAILLKRKELAGTMTDEDRSRMIKLLVKARFAAAKHAVLGEIETRRFIRNFEAQLDLKEKS